MSSGSSARPEASELSHEELAEGLTAGAVGECWSERAAVGLLVSHGGWLGRRELRAAIETNRGLDGELFAWVVWDRVDVAHAAGSSSDLRVLALACSLGGVPSDQPLSDLLSSLGPTNTIHVLEAVWLACTGHGLTRRHLS